MVLLYQFLVDQSQYIPPLNQKKHLSNQEVEHHLILVVPAEVTRKTASGVSEGDEEEKEQKWKRAEERRSGKRFYGAGYEKKKTKTRKRFHEKIDFAMQASLPR